MIINGYGVMGFHDPHAIRPLVYGKRDNGNGLEFMLASESIALDALGFELLGDVGPGEVIYFDREGQIHREQCAKMVSHSPCIFEYIYLVRPDSIMDNVPVYQAWPGMDKSLVKKILREQLDHDIDVIIPILDTSRNAAHGFSPGFKNSLFGRVCEKSLYWANLYYAGSSYASAEFNTFKIKCN